MAWLYSEWKVSENQARPWTMGPETPTRGYQLPRCNPFWMRKPGMKLVVAKRKASDPFSVSMARAPAEPLPTSGEERPEERSRERIPSTAIRVWKSPEMGLAMLNPLSRY